MNIKKRIKKIINYYKYIPNLIRHLLYFILVLLSIKYPLTILIVLIIVGVTLLLSFIKNSAFMKQTKGNGIIYGAKGAGKGILLNYRIRKDKTKPFCNVPYENSELLKDIGEYLNSISPLTIHSFINNEIKTIPKIKKFEGRNVYIDDINIYAPNWADSQLKKKYPSLPPMLAINRHLYNHYLIVTTQDRERPYKIIKELQTDFSIKALKTKGFSHFWNCLPFFRNYVYTKYIYHELPKSSDLLPFKGKGLINEGIKSIALSSGQSIKEVYKAKYGIIKYGFVFQRKKKIKYDTRYFHKVVYGYTSEEIVTIKKKGKP